jgi:16S rRNA (guanine1207-N2)-methyltransferase
MGEQYFTKDPTSQSRTAEAVWEHNGQEFTFLTDSGVFCRGHVDYGSKLLVESLPPLSGRGLDLGCGYGFMGIAVKLLYPSVNMVLCDINSRALALSKRNAEAHKASVEILQSDGFSNITGKFDFILCNPPVRAGKAVYYPWFEEAARRLNPGGALTIVLQRKQGAPSAQKRLEELYPDVEIIGHGAGYHIISAKTSESE